MRFYTSVEIQDYAKSMLEVQARIKNSLMNMFWTSRNQETLKKYSEDNQDSRYLFASFLPSRKTQDLNSVQDRSMLLKNQDNKHKGDLYIQQFDEIYI